MDEEFKMIDLMQKDAPDVRFEGRLVAELDSREVDKRFDKPGKGGDRFTRLELYELKSGQFVAANVACSDREGEVDIAKVWLVGRKRDEWETATSDPGLNSKETRRVILEAFGWTWLAKAFADRMGWNHVQELG